jgi:hypothetical protein
MVVDPHPSGLTDSASRPAAYGIRSAARVSAFGLLLVAAPSGAPRCRRRLLAPRPAAAPSAPRCQPLSPLNAAKRLAPLGCRVINSAYGAMSWCRGPGGPLRGHRRAHPDCHRPLPLAVAPVRCPPSLLGAADREDPVACAHRAWPRGRIRTCRLLATRLPRGGRGLGGGPSGHPTPGCPHSTPPLSRPSVPETIGSLVSATSTSCAGLIASGCRRGSCCITLALFHSVLQDREPATPCPHL